jgi:hypothetical protein
LLKVTRISLVAAASTFASPDYGSVFTTTGGAVCTLTRLRCTAAQTVPPQITAATKTRIARFIIVTLS